MVDGFDADPVRLVIDPIDDSEVAATGSMSTGQLQMELSSDAPRIVGERSVGELENGRGDFFR